MRQRNEPAVSILVASFHMLNTGAVYEDLGADWFGRLRPERHARRLVHQLETLGLQRRDHREGRGLSEDDFRASGPEPDKGSGRDNLRVLFHFEVHELSDLQRLPCVCSTTLAGEAGAPEFGD